MNRSQHRQVASTVTFTGALLLAVPLAMLATTGHVVEAVVLAVAGGPWLAWLHEHL